MNKYKQLSNEEMKGTAAGRKKSCSICWKKIYPETHPVETKQAVPDCAKCLLK